MAFRFVTDDDPDDAAQQHSSTLAVVGAGMVAAGIPMYFIGRSKYKKLSMAVQQEPLSHAPFRHPAQHTQISLAFHF